MKYREKFLCFLLAVCAAIVSVGVVRAAYPDGSEVVLYHFEQGTGTVVNSGTGSTTYDSAMTGNAAYYATTTTPFGGYGAIFDTAGDYVDTKFGSGVDPTATPISVSLWVNKTVACNSDTGDDHVFGYGATGQNTRFYIRCRGTTGRWNYRIGGAAEVNVGSAVGLNRWYHLAMVTEGTNLGFYINGVHQGTTTISSFTIPGSLHVGSINATADQGFNGVIDEVALYNKSLTYNEVINIYAAGASTLFSATTTTATEGGATGSYSIALKTEPSSDVTVTPSPDADVSVNPTFLTFTSANWFTPQTVTVTAVDDGSVEGEHTGTITHSAASSDTNYNGIQMDDVVIAITDNEAAPTPGITVSDTTMAVTEGGATDSYTLVLDSEPSSSVTITATTTLNRVTRSPLSVTFTTENWDTPQTITITAVNDSVSEGTQTDTIIHTVISSDENYNGFSVDNVGVTITDNDSATVWPGTNQRLLVNPSGAEPSAIMWHPRLLKWFFVHDGGSPVSSLYVMDYDGSSLKRLSLDNGGNWDIEGITFAATSSDKIYLLYEGNQNAGTGEIWEVDAQDAIDQADGSTLAVDRKFDVADVSISGGNGPEALVFIPEPSNAEGGYFMVSSQVDGRIWLYRLPIVTSAVSTSVTHLDSAPYNSPIGPVISGFTDLAALDFNRETNQLLIIYDGATDNLLFTNASTTVIYANYDTPTGSTPQDFEGISLGIGNQIGVANDAGGIYIYDFPLGRPSASIVVSPTTAAVTEGGTTDTYDVVLGTQATSTVTVTINSTAEATTNPTSLTFTLSNWNIPQTVTITAVNDSDVEGEHSTVITHTSSSADGNFAGLGIDDVDVTITDNDEADVTAPTITNVSSDKPNGSYTVGEVIDIDVTFSEAVTSTGNVTVTLETGTTDRTCIFTVSNATTGTCNYTVQAGDTSSDLEATISGTIADQSANAMSDFVPATNLADNKALVIDTTNPTISTLSPADDATGVSASTNLVLTFDAAVTVNTGDITIKKASDDTTVEAIDANDDQVSGSGTAIITVNPSVTLAGLTSYYVQVANTAFRDIALNSYAGISDTTSWSFTTAALGTPGVTVTPASVDVSESGISDTYTLVLDGQPTDDVVVTPISSGGEVVVSPTTVTFTNSNWDTPQTITVTAVDDLDTEGTHSDTITHSTTSDDPDYEGLSVSFVTVTITDNEASQNNSGGGGSSSGGSGGGGATVYSNLPPGLSLPATPLTSDKFSLLLTLLRHFQRLSLAPTIAPQSLPAGALPPEGAYTQPMAVGSEGPQVRALQTLLASFIPEVYPEKLITGYYGSLTERAIKKFQTVNNIAFEGEPGFGTVGPKTRIFLNSLRSSIGSN